MTKIFLLVFAWTPSVWAARAGYVQAHGVVRSYNEKTVNFDQQGQITRIPRTLVEKQIPLKSSVGKKVTLRIDARTTYQGFEAPARYGD